MTDSCGRAGEQHEFRTTCSKCGESGQLFVALLGSDEQATISARSSWREISRELTADMNYEEYVLDAPDKAP